jgi:transcriptional regulator with XRE-family HTH domain
VRGQRNDGKPKKKAPLPARRKSVKSAPIAGSLGAILHAERQKRQIAQREIAAAMAKKTGRSTDNVRLSQIELGRSLPDDTEIGILANMFGLSAATLRAKRDAELKTKTERAQTYIKSTWERPTKQRKTLLAPKPSERAAAKSVTRWSPPPSALAVARPEPAGQTELADWIEMADSSVCVMPVDTEGRRRWLQAAIELFKLRGLQ